LEPNHATTSQTAESLQDLRNSCHEFVQFFNSLKEVRDTRPDASVIVTSGRYPFVELAVNRLKSFARYPFPVGGQKLTSHTHIEETIRLVALFYLAVTWRDCLLLPQSFGNGLEEVNSALQLKANMKTNRWHNSIENLYTIAVSGRGMALNNPVRSGYVIQLMGVARLLDLPSWMRVRESLCAALLGTLSRDSSELSWDEDLLYTELVDRY